MRKKLLSIALAVFLATSSLPVSAVQAAELPQETTAEVPEDSQTTEETVEAEESVDTEKETVETEIADVTEEDEITEAESTEDSEINEIPEAEDNPEEEEQMVSDGLLRIDETNFPDASFREYLEMRYDEDGDGMLDPLSITRIDICNIGDTYTCKVKNLQGLEYFTKLTDLSVTSSNSELSSLDISKNTALQTLDIWRSSIKQLDLSQNKALNRVTLFHANITELDVSGLENLETLTVPYPINLKVNSSLSSLTLMYEFLPETVDVSRVQGLSFKGTRYNAANKTVTIGDGISFDGGYPTWNFGWKKAENGTNTDVSFGGAKLDQPNVLYRTHVQTYGWEEDWAEDGAMSGTSGKAKRLEAIRIGIRGDEELGIQYTTHCQSYGWLPWAADGESSGTEGEAKRLEAIKIKLTGADKDRYDVYYRVHAQSYGWLAWAKNGEPAGTAGYAKRLEGIQIVIVKKGSNAPGLDYNGINASKLLHQTSAYIYRNGSSPVLRGQTTANANPTVAGDTVANVIYRTHVQSYGWQGWKYNGDTSGTVGQAKRLEGIEIDLTNYIHDVEESDYYDNGIRYTTHVQSYGWQNKGDDPFYWAKNGELSGTTGEAKRLEAIRIALLGKMEENYDIYYRVHAQTYGWLAWAKNGEPAGTAGMAKRLEGIQIVLVKKGGTAPANNYDGVTSVRSEAYISK